MRYSKGEAEFCVADLAKARTHLLGPSTGREIISQPCQLTLLHPCGMEKGQR